ncbi:MAG: hypothetical protein IPJ71_12490 [Bdellovibrionales bacterium]|nr:hypothetical protein [Bdellovibrionales bacterium]
MSKTVIGGIQGIPPQQFSSLMERILSTVKNSPRPMSESDLLERVTGRKQYKVKVVRYCLENKLVNRTGSGKRGDPFLYSYSEHSVVETNQANPLDGKDSKTKPEANELSPSDFNNLRELFALLHAIKLKAS